MKDQNGLTLRVGDEVAYCEDLFQVAGEDGGRAIIWPIDPELNTALTVETAQLTRVHTSLWVGFVRWIRDALSGRQIPVP